MTPADLSPIMRKAYEALSETEKETFLLEQEALYSTAIKGAISRVMNRNLSHNVGKHVLKTQKEN